tara:strand:- start:902 stop:1120 length:219 start_codon:yes stop_codon:yes gene_type:complete
MGRVTEFIHFINIDPKELKLGQNMKGDSYTHMTIRMTIKRARYEHQTKLRRQEQEKIKSAKAIREYFRRKKK